MHATFDSLRTDSAGRLLGFLAGVSLAGALFVAGCDDGSDGDRGPQGPPGPPADSETETDLDPEDDAPGVVATITDVSGASGADGTFQVGDRIAVTFTLLQDDATTVWGLVEMAEARAMVSGPTFNYQRVIAEQSDVAAVATENSDGSYTYELPPLPATYLAPLNDTGSFGLLDGELQGQSLLAGTYTVALNFVWAYDVEGDAFVDVGEAEVDVLFGGAATVLPRDVAGEANCERCHVDLQAHGGERHRLLQCVMCHTSGAEDLNDANVGGGTPGVTIDSRVLFHKIHNGRHLPSVIGIGVNPNGSLDYTATPTPFVVANGAGELVDYSDVGFPAYPDRAFPTLKDFGYSGLTAAAQAKDDLVRTGITSCHLCHGDPDGAGPLQAPTQGDLIYAQPARKSCGACHDDVDWDLDYQTNGQIMPPQADDSECAMCHESTSGPISVPGGHMHASQDSFLNPGLVFDLTSVDEAGTNDGDGDFDPGEGMSVTFRMRDSMGNDVLPSTLDELRAIVSGPSENLQVLLPATIPTAILTGPQPFTVVLPEERALEFVGDSTAAPNETFPTSGSPHLDVTGAETFVQLRTATSGGSTTLAVDAAAASTFLDVVDATGFARDDHVVIDDGFPLREAYFRIQLVEANRLWLASPATTGYGPAVRIDHGSGATVREVTLTTLTEGVDYTLDAALGEVTEIGELGVGSAVIVSYTTDWIVPSEYPATLHESPDVDRSYGGWSGKSLVAGTYRVGLWGTYDFNFPFAAETNMYSVTSEAAFQDVPFADASTIEPYALIDDAASCNECHVDLSFHDGLYRGFDSCVLCHGGAGTADLPTWVAANAPATDGVTVNFRTLLHKIHHGAALDDTGFAAVGAGPDPWPDNYRVNTFDDVFFPPFPGATMQCAKCHGDANEAWKRPAPRDHPTDQDTPVQGWRAACVTCHDDAAAEAHVQANTAPTGVESCDICHAPGEEWEVELMHKTR